MRTHYFPWISQQKKINVQITLLSSFSSGLRLCLKTQMTKGFLMARKNLDSDLLDYDANNSKGPASSNS
jgi:hypothetical protein